MTRAQCIVHRGRQILMVMHRQDGEEWWCLPGGGIGLHEAAAQAALRELEEECCVMGKIVYATSQSMDGAYIQSITFLVEIGLQEPRMGADPEFTASGQVLADVRWLRLAEIPERDRAYLWEAGLLNVPGFPDEVSGWGGSLSYPTG